MPKTTKTFIYGLVAATILSMSFGSVAMNIILNKQQETRDKLLTIQDARFDSLASLVGQVMPLVNKNGEMMKQILAEHGRDTVLVEPKFPAVIVQHDTLIKYFTPIKCDTKYLPFPKGGGWHTDPRRPCQLKENQ